jgi:hypothetical protein
VAASTASLANAAISAHEARLGRIGVIVAASLVILVAVVADAFKDAGGFRESISEAAAALTARVGRARWLFSALLLAAGYAAFADSSGRIAVLYLSWFVILGLAPVESALTLLLRKRETRPIELGLIEALDDPSTVTARFPKGTDVNLGDAVTVADGATRGTVVEVTRLAEEPRARVALDEAGPVRVGSTATLVPGDADQPVAGHVVEGTSIEEIVLPQCLSLQNWASRRDASSRQS